MPRRKKTNFQAIDTPNQLADWAVRWLDHRPGLGARRQKTDGNAGGALRFGDGKHRGQRMPAIVHIIDFGTAWTVKLDCGCSRKGLTAEDIEREQLYVDKRVECERREKERFRRGRLRGARGCRMSSRSPTGAIA